MNVDGVKATGYGRLFVVSGPSGVGKDAVVGRAFERLKGVVASVSATTRPPRPGETEGIDYYFLSREQFEDGIAQDIFFEYAPYSGNLYGTPRAGVDLQRANGLDVFLIIEVKGAKAVKRLAPDAILIFIQPPSPAELEHRLRKRGADTEARILERLAIAKSELDCIPLYDYLLTNDNLEAAADTLCAIVIAERHRIMTR